MQIFTWYTCRDCRRRVHEQICGSGLRCGACNNERIKNGTFPAPVRPENPRIRPYRGNHESNQ